MADKFIITILFIGFLFEKRSQGSQLHCMKLLIQNAQQVDGRRPGSIEGGFLEKKKRGNAFGKKPSMKQYKKQILKTPNKAMEAMKTSLERTELTCRRHIADEQKQRKRGGGAQAQAQERRRRHGRWTARAKNRAPPSALARRCNASCPCQS